MKIAASVTPNKTKFGPLLFPGEMEKAFHVLHDSGYDGVEISLRDPAALDRKKLDKDLSKYNLEFLSIATGQSFVEDGFALYAAEEENRTNALERLKGHINLASEYNASVIIGGIRGKIRGAFDPETIKKEGDIVFIRCASYADSKGVTLLLEPLNRYESDTFIHLDEAAEFIVDNNLPNVKILADTYHMNIEEAEIGKSLSINKPYIAALHCADSNRLYPGSGHVDFYEVFAEAVKNKNLIYAGVEVLTGGDSFKAAREAISEIKKHLQAGW